MRRAVTPRTRTILSVALRTTIGVGAMLLVLRSVSWHDWATLEDGSRVRIENWAEVSDDPRLEDPARAGELRLEIDEPPGTVGLDRVARDADGTLRIKVGLATAARSADPTLILLSLLCFAPVPVLQSLRFQWMVRAQDIELSVWEAMKLCYAGNFLNFVALGSTGGDVFKAYYVSTHTHRKTEAVTTVLLDRGVGMVGLVSITLVAMALRLDDPRIREWVPAVVVLLAALLAGVLVAFSGRARRRMRLESLIERLPWSDHVRRIDAATYRMRHHPRLLAAALALSVALQGLAITSFALAGVGLGMRGGLEVYPDYLCFLALGLLVAAVPISYQGLGTMDAALQIFLRGVYGNFSQVLFLGFAIRLVQLAWSLPGALVPLTGAHRPGPEKLAQIQAP